MWDKQNAASYRQVRRDKKASSIGFSEETGEGCFELEFTVGEQEFQAVAGAHLLQAVVSALFLGQGGIFLLFLKAGDEIPV